MKILKKIGLTCLIALICFSATIHKVSAYNEEIGDFSLNGPPLSSNIGSADLTIYDLNGNSCCVPIGTTFWNSFPNSFLLNSSYYIGYENFTHVSNGSTLINQDFAIQEYGGWKYLLTFRDIYLLNEDYAFPRITFDINTINYEQSFDFTWNAIYYDWDTGLETHIGQSNYIQFDTTDNRIWTYDMSSYFKDQFRLEQNNYTYVYIKELNIDIGYADFFSDSNSTILAINDMQISNNFYTQLETEFFSDLKGVHTNSLFQWLTNSISAFLDTDIFPNFNLGTILGVIVAIPLLIYILKLFLGG